MNPYKNYKLFRKNSKIKKDMVNNTCFVCGNYGNVAHHRDFSKDNHKIENLVILCKPCHRNVHSWKNDRSVFGYEKPLDWEYMEYGEFVKKYFPEGLDIPDIEDWTKEELDLTNDLLSLY